MELITALDGFITGTEAGLLFVQERGTSDALSWWSTWWGSLVEEAPRAA